MKVGLNLVFGGGYANDQELWRDELAQGDLAEPLGFDSVWGTEHHFTDYIICPDALQYLTWIAARTEEILLGSQVVVLPWHDPLRVAEQVSMLDTMSNGRYIFGFGRGAARIEFAGFRMPMEESRGRYAESSAMIIQGLEQGYVEYDGEYIKQPRVPIRPAPFKSFKGRTYSAAISPESMEIVGKLGVGLLLNPHKAWDVLDAELTEYRDIFRKAHGREAPPPAVEVFTLCHSNATRAEEMMRDYLPRFYHDILQHYEFEGDHFESTKGYESYGQMSKDLRAVGEDEAAESYLDLQPWGTPDQCIEQITEMQRKIGTDHINFSFRFADMPAADAAKSMRLFAEEVLPVVKKIEVPAAV
jgi:alkanesulfonate monooxygenase SsuD/methylene tetrahydromethanopterin reductase-like flavin-dependent oxidoreductase (luciferase family)